MIELLNLDEIGPRLRRIDRQLIDLLSQRMALSVQIEEYKERSGQPILRPEIEEKRLTEVAEWANEKGVNPSFARAILYFIIKESCSVQIDHLQNERHDSVPPSDAEWHQTLKQNLLSLTAKIANSYDEMYDGSFFATHAYTDFENSVLERELALIKDKSLALNIGCATGRVSFILSSSFDQVAGYDISPDMIDQSEAKLTAGNIQNIGFEVVDAESGIPLDDSSVSFVVMNMGTASDIYNLEGLLSEIKRVLVPNGRFLFSFYNADALFYRWFIPWPISLAAEINLQKHCLDVHYKEKNDVNNKEEVYSVYARPYTVPEVKMLLSDGLSVFSVSTYPTVSSILPRGLFDEAIVRESITEIDSKLTSLNSGAYILVTGMKG